MVTTKKRCDAPRFESLDFLECVRDAIGRRLASAVPNADEIAEGLGVSPQGMREMLRKQDTSLEQITAQVLARNENHLQ